MLFVCSKNSVHSTRLSSPHNNVLSLLEERSSGLVLLCKEYESYDTGYQALHETMVSLYHYMGFYKGYMEVDVVLLDKL